MTGQFKVEGYRVEVDVGGMFGNPNEMALHFVMTVSYTHLTLPTSDLV